MFAYCYNDPINKVDYSGNFAITLAGFAAVASSKAIGFLGVLALTLLASYALSSVPTTYPDSSRDVDITLPIIIIIYGAAAYSFKPPQRKHNEQRHYYPMPKTNTRPRREDEDDTVVYRWARNENSDPREFQNLTPRPNDLDGISFSLVPPTNGRPYTTTTLGQLRDAGFTYTISGNHVSVVPPGGESALAEWRSTYYTANDAPHLFTLMLFAITQYM